MVRKIDSAKSKARRPIDKNQRTTRFESLIKWTFHDVDKAGKFAFDPSRPDFDTEDFLHKLLNFSTMTWSELADATHDQGKSKHHELDISGLSKEALARIEAKHLVDETDALFSFALNNKVRVIGIRDGAEFQVVWYDASHEFCPSDKKHT